MKKLFILFSLLVTSSSIVWASNLQLSNLDEVSVNTAAGTMTFSVNISQDNSWRNQTNYDAVWVFMKYSIDGGTTWQHAKMAGSGINPAGFSLPVQFQNQFEIMVPPEPDQKGFFLQRTAQGSGSFAITSVQFVWNYGADLGGVNTVTAAQAQASNTIQNVYGIEMVYIPQGAFYAGDGSYNEYALGTQSSTVSNPWYIQSENALNTTGTASSGGTSPYYYQSTGASGEYTTGSLFTIPPQFPKGYGAFYLMKYELTEGQWVSFFNTLPNSAKSYRDITSNSTIGTLKIGGKGTQGVVYRNTISWPGSTNPLLISSPATTLRPSRPVSFLSWPDVAAYAEWAALRPITELEYEKAARGLDPAAPGQFVWGASPMVIPSAGDIKPNADENGAETLNDNANINSGAISWSSGDGRSGAMADNQQGPLRVGIFAASTPANASYPRVSAGAGFYGNMELSGNLATPVVTVGKQSASNFIGSNGTGVLTSNGFATNLDWPGMDGVTSNGVDSTSGIGYRGGDFASTNPLVYATSARFYAVKDPDSQSCAERFDASCGVFQGGRLGRSVT